MSQMNPKEVFHNTAYSVQLPYIAGHSLLSEHLLIEGHARFTKFPFKPSSDQ